MGSAFFIAGAAKGILNKRKQRGTMVMIRIGILDRETEYVTKLCAYLNRYGKGIWSVSAFTEKEALMRYMSDKRLDMAVATDSDVLMQMRDTFSDRCYVLLSEEREHKSVGTSEKRIYMIYRYQSARLIGEALRDIVEYLGMLMKADKKSAVIYSPVGRCGKTTLAMSFVREAAGEKWLYVGMEDYGGKWDYGDVDEEGRRGIGADKEIYRDSSGSIITEDFIYYLKERDEKAVLGVISRCGGMLPSAFSLFDTRLVDREDMKWFFEVFEKVVEYRGVIIDMGTGILRDINVLSEFKYIIVPYINDSISLAKRKQFEELIVAYELGGIRDRIKYIDMSGEELVQELRKLMA